jgi:hypothetical protein
LIELFPVLAPLRNYISYRIRIVMTPRVPAKKTFFSVELACTGEDTD